MRFIDEYRASDLSAYLAEQIARISVTPVRIMEVCGSHTVSIFRNGIRALLPDTITLLSGPGCPVCVTAQGEIDAMIGLSEIDDVIIVTFGDMLRVPGTSCSLMQVRSEGRDVRVVYSCEDDGAIADANPDRRVVFLGIGFETTAPLIASTILSAKQAGLKNFSVFSAHKRVPEVLAALMAYKDLAIDGLILPGHVSMVIGKRAYWPLYAEYPRPYVIAGFEPVDILNAILLIVGQIEAKAPRLKNAYPRAVSIAGNKRAQEMMASVFQPSDANWRGLGRLAGSGLKIRRHLEAFDAEKIFQMHVSEQCELEGCDCGKVLLGLKTPPECPLYKKVCTPSYPVGPCMVSSEGTCGAYYRYAEK